MKIWTTSFLCAYCAVEMGEQCCSKYLQNFVSNDLLSKEKKEEFITTLNTKKAQRCKKSSPNNCLLQKSKNLLCN